jgi:hypothetical protein
MLFILLPASAWWIIAGAINALIIVGDMVRTLGLTNNGQGGGGGF